MILNNFAINFVRVVWHLMKVPWKTAGDVSGPRSKQTMVSRTKTRIHDNRKWPSRFFCRVRMLSTPIVRAELTRKGFGKDVHACWRPILTPLACGTSPSDKANSNQQPSYICSLSTSIFHPPDLPLLLLNPFSAHYVTTCESFA